MYVTRPTFYRIDQMPNVIGCIYGILINIDSPHKDEAQFVDSQGNHSLNCTVVSDRNYAFFYGNAY